jgi:hypothetical protein
VRHVTDRTDCGELARRSAPGDFPALRLMTARAAHQENPIALILDHPIMATQRAERLMKECD